MSDEDTQTIDKPVPVPAPEAKPAAAAPAAPEKPKEYPRTREQLRAEGWDDKELELAEKDGQIAPEPKAAAKPAAPKKDAAAAPEAPAAPAASGKELEAAKPEDGEAKPAPKGGLPDFTFTAEEQAGVEKLFGKGHPARAFYFRTKAERAERQKAQARASQLEARLAALEAGGRPAAEPGAEGAEVDLDKPLTARMLADMQKRDEEKRLKAQEAQRERYKVVTTAQKEQEEYAKTVYPDFMPTVELAKDVMQNFETLFPEKWKQDEVLGLMRELQVAALNADQFGIEDNHAAHVAHKIGRMHPKYGKASAPAGDAPKTETQDKTGPKDPKAAGGLKPETLSRIEKNTQRRSSSAAVPSGGGERAIVADEVTAEMLDAMPSKEREAFRDAHPAQYARLLAG